MWLRGTLIAILFILALGPGADASDFGCAFNPDRLQLNDPCPKWTTDSITTQNASFSYFDPMTMMNVTVSQTRTTVTGTMGWCGSYMYPRDVFGGSGGTIGDEEHSYIMTIPDAWCYDAHAFSTCLAERPSPYYPPPYAVNVRPLVSHCGDATAPGIPMWDTGGYYYRAITVRVNDSCGDITIPKFDSRSRFLMSGINTTFVLGSAPPSGADVYLSSRIAECHDGFLSVIPECVECRSTCSFIPLLSCDEPVRTRPITTYPSLVRLVCQDPDYGMVWRVDNRQAPGLHFDWAVKRGSNLSLVNATAATGITIPVNNSDRNPLFDDPLENGFWPGTTGKHTAAPGNHFYIPTWVDDPPGPLGPDRPSVLELYAGAPNHYVGTTTVGALVQFFDINELMQLDELDAMLGSPFTFDLVDTTFPEDLTRQSLLYICSTPGVAGMAGFLASNGTENWVPFCDAVTDASATWPEMFNLTVSTFNLGNISDPLPACSCTEVLSNCGNQPLSEPLRFQYDYRRTRNRTVDVAHEPVCKMPVFGEAPLNVTNIPPLTFFNGSSTPVVYETIPLTAANPYLAFWPDPKEIMGSDFEYSVSPLGVLWTVTNQNMDPLATSVTIRQEIGNVNMMGDVFELTDPFELGDELILAPNRTRWFFSRTLVRHRIYGSINWPCTTSGCPEGQPTDPADASGLPSGVVGSSFFDFILEDLDQATLDALPDCECRVNAPCDADTFLYETATDLDVTTLPVPPGPPPPPPTAVPLPGCVPETEVCDCYDNDCNGFIDDVLFLNEPCGFSDVGRCELGIFRCTIDVCNASVVNVTNPLVCQGYVPPALEKCDNQDWDCDGILNNVPGMGQPCGTDIGICEKGTLQCDPPNPELVCMDGIEPLSFDLCGDGLDNDCNGLIDDNCIAVPTAPAPPTPPATPGPSPPTPPPATSPIPSASPASPSPSAPTDGGFPGGIDLPEFDVQPRFDAATIAFLLSLFVCWAILLCVWCCRRRRRRYTGPNRISIF